MLGSSGQELLLWELRLVQERLNLKNSGLIPFKSEKEETSVKPVEPSSHRNVPDLVSLEGSLERESNGSSVDSCEEELEADGGNGNGLDHQSNSVIGACEGESDEKEGGMDILPQRSEVTRRYPVSIDKADLCQTQTKYQNKY